MSTTSLVRTDSRNSFLSSITPTSSREPSRQQSSTSSPLAAVKATATTILPKLNRTPQKDSSTPQKAGTPQQHSSPAVSTPGRWEHPRTDEVIRRQTATRFDASNARVCLLNGLLLAFSFLAPWTARNTLPRAWTFASQPYATYFIYLLRLFALLNIGLACYPLVRGKDNCEDIPLTPAQRFHLGLPPMTRSATPQEQEQYVTPPRYSRSTTPQSGTPSSMRAIASGSPLNGRGSPLDGGSLRRSVSGSPFGSQQQRPSPLGGSGFRSPAGGDRRRLSFQSTLSSPITTAEFDAVGSIGTPTKSNKASVGLNSKWLYEKGRASPRASVGGLAGFGGTGSVFS